MDSSVLNFILENNKLILKDNVHWKYCLTLSSDTIDKKINELESTFADVKTYMYV